MGHCTPAKTGSSETGWGIQPGVVLASGAGCASRTGGSPTCSGDGFSSTHQGTNPGLGVDEQQGCHQSLA